MDKMKNQIMSYIQSTGILFLNENRYLPSVSGLGGDWNTVMRLILEREIYLSKLYMNRTTYLSKEMYFYLKRFKQTGLLSDTEQKIYCFLEESGGADTEMLKNSLMLPDKDFNISMNSLLKNLYVTALGPVKRLNENWTTLLWGTYRQWEEGCSIGECSLSDEECRNEITGILSKNLTVSKINKILGFR